MTRTNGGGRAVDGDDARLKQVDRTSRIRALNDASRTSMRFSFVYATIGVRSLADEAVTVAIDRVRRFDAFTADNDPHGEHDFGSFDLSGNRLFWKIDYYDRQLKHGSPDPTDASVTARVLTIMLASEY